MHPETFYSMLVVVALLAPLALQSEVRRIFGWSVGYPRALLITTLAFGAFPLIAFGGYALGLLPNLPEDAPAFVVSLVQIVSLVLVGVWCVCVFLVIALLLRSPSGYPLRVAQIFRITLTTGGALAVLTLGLTLSLHLAITRLIPTPISQLPEVYNGPVVLIGVYLFSVSTVYGCIAWYSQSELRWEPDGHGLWLMVFGSPLIFIAGLAVVRPLLPGTPEVVALAHMLTVLLAATTLIVAALWALLSLDARRPLPLLRVGRLGFYVTVVLLGMLTVLEVAAMVAGSAA